MEELLLDGLIYYTFYRYLFSRREELAKMGISIYAKKLPANVVRYVCKDYCIDL